MEKSLMSNAKSKKQSPENSVKKEKARKRLSRIPTRFFLHFVNI
jgi:hypothetical protein